jgi:hypothetical protein
MLILGFISFFLVSMFPCFQPLLLLCKGDDLGLSICGCCSQETANEAGLDVSFDNMQEWETKTGESREI